MATSKFSWQAAKFGVRLAKKPIEKWVLRNQERVVLELTPADFKKMMIAAAKKIVLHQEEINRINVFPVADKDTGYNLAATLLGVEGVVSAKNYLTFRELSQDIKEAAMINARGNAGMIYTGYIVEFLDRIKHLKTIDAFHLALAMKRGIRAARNSVSEPVEGTILDVVRTVGLKSFTYAKTKKEKNILKILTEAHKESLQSLKETKEKLPVLKENDVVDAGALGFVKILEAWIDSLRGVEPVNSIEPGSMVQPQAGEKLEYKYEVVATFKNDRDLDLQKVKNELSPLGNSLDVVLVDDKIKFHIHTNQPENVQKKFKDFPDFSSRVEDMEGLIEKKKKLPLGLVIGETADLPADFLTKHNIIKVPFIARFPDGQTFSSSDEIIPEIRKALDQGRPLPISSAPSFKDFLTVYNSALERFEKILVLTLSSKLSGAYSSARIARSFFKKPDKLNIYVFDCNNAEAGEGLIAQHAQELIDQGKDLEEVIEELKTFCPKVNLLLCLDDFRCIARGGRLRIPEFLASSISFLQKAGLRFLISLKNGQLRFYQIGLGRDPVKILLREIKKKSQGKRIRLAITQTDNLPLAERLRKELRKDSQVEIALTSLASPAVVVHAGPGALLVAFYLIDK